MGAKKFLQHRKRLSFISTLVLLAFLNLITGCSYYKVITKTNIPSEKYLEMEQNNKYLILHYQNKVWHLTDIKIVDSVMLIGKILMLPLEHRRYVETNPEKKNRYKIISENDETSVLDEVHIYASEVIISNNSTIFVPLESVEKIEIYEKDKKATSKSLVLGIIVSTVLTSIVILIIVGTIAMKDYME